MAKPKVELTRDFLQWAYIEQEMSTVKIAKMFNEWPTTIRRLLIDFNIPLRDHSQAQLKRLQQGGHPSKGRKHTKEAKTKISRAMLAKWSENPEDRLKLSRRKRREWMLKSQEEKDAFIQMGHEASLKVHELGSKLENFLYLFFVEKRFVVERNGIKITPTSRCRGDLYFPVVGVVVRVEGAHYYESFYGKVELARLQQHAIDVQNKMLAAGLCLFRVKNVADDFSLGRAQHLAEKMLVQLQEIRRQRPPEDKRVFHFDVMEYQGDRQSTEDVRDKLDGLGDVSSVG